MDTKEKHIRENEGHRHDASVNEDLIQNSLKANGKKRKNQSTRRINNLWLWLGVLVLILILIWWIYTLCIGADITGAVNG